LLILNKAIKNNLVKTLGDLYNVLKGIVPKNPEDLGPFTRAYYAYFLNIDIKNGERLNDAIIRSETFKKWKEDFQLNRKLVDLDIDQLVEKFLDEVHLTSYDIKEIIDGKELFDKDSGDINDENPDASLDALETQKNLLDKMADYSDLSLEELLERMKEIAEQQKGKHSGGSHWIGTGGISPYGHGGAAKNGIRVGGTGGGKMARQVLNDRNFFPVDVDKIINDNNVDAALASLKGIIEESAQEKLDVENTIKNGLKRGGLFIPEIKNISQEKLQVILLIDNGGYSMMPYIKTIMELFKKMKTRFAHDLETYYFHNTVYDRVYTNAQRNKSIPTKKLLDKNKDYRVFIIGDADMGPYEINKLSIKFYQDLVNKFKRTVWLNPEPEKYWSMSFTINLLKQLVNMFPLTPKGIENAVLEMNRKKI